ncbi:MAG: GntR family transcriptional regulator [Candidatus Accumulibacter sp.]|nr:GntR family transcriptional regulator [Accumulibacter sp.]
MVRKKTAYSRISEKIAETLEERIVFGRYLPGMRLDETELAEELSVSRTPVREALIQLSFHGLIDIRPRRGAVVTQVSPQRLYEMFEVMAELEAMCARLAARRHNDDDIKSILESQNACSKTCESNDIDTYYHANERFHRTIYEASHNSFLNERTSRMFRNLGVYRRLQLRIRGRLTTSHSEHTEIVEAILAGDSQLAATRIHKHVIVQGELFSDLIASIVNLGASVSHAAQS